MTTKEAIAIIRQALRQRSGKSWSVSTGRGTDYGWITILSKPSRRVECNHLSVFDRFELSQLLGFDQTVSRQGVFIPASDDYYNEYISRAKGMYLVKRAEPYWDYWD